MKAGESPEAISLAPATTAGIMAARETEASAAHDGFELLRRSIPQFGDLKLRLLSRIGRVAPESLAAYRASGGYAALARALELGPEGVIGEVMASKLMGRGGAAFPTGRKWDAVAKARARPHYVVCNADESEPGTFKDRVLMEGDPFAVIEGMTIAAFATGCERGYLYVRGEYPAATRRLTVAITAARAAGLLGANVMNSGFQFDLELRSGAGAYICGEETALFNSIEGKRGEPREQASVSGSGRPLRQADGREQCGNPGEYPAHRFSRGCGLCGDRHTWLVRAQAFLCFGPGGEARRLRG